MHFQFRKIDVIECINESWRIFKENMGMAIVGWLLATFANTAVAVLIWFINTIVNVFLVMAVGLPASAMVDGGGAESASGTVLGIGMIVLHIGSKVFFQVLQITFSLIVSAGLLSFYIKFAKNEKAPDLKTLIVLDKRVWYIFLYYLLYGLMIGALICISLAPAGICLGFAVAEKISFTPVIVLGILGGVILLVILIYLQMSLAQGLYFIVDKRVGPIDAITLSIKSMKGNKWSFFAIGLLVGAIGAVVVLFTCFIGVILVSPFTLLLFAKVYVNIVGEEFIPEQLEIENEHWYKQANQNDYR